MGFLQRTWKGARPSPCAQVAPYARAAAVMAEEALDGRAVRVGLIRARGTTGASAPLLRLGEAGCTSL